MKTRSLAFLACCCVSLVGCATDRLEGPQRVSASGARLLDETEMPSIAGPAMEALLEDAGVCPAGFDLVPVKAEDPRDVNRNGYVCTDGTKVVDDLAPGTCPFGFKLVQVKVGDPVDENGNGVACSDGVSVVDDVVKGEDADTEFVGGHGNFLSGKQDISFSFHGKQNKALVIKGEFEMHDQTSGVRLHGDVTCLRVEANQARLGGTITQSTDAKLPVGATVVWIAADNGEGQLDKPDLVSRPSQAKDPKNDCHRLLKLDWQPIIGGNIQVLR
jgi:hypothetical protein